MRKWLCVPMMMALLLSGCGAGETKETTADTLRGLYREMSGCTMEALVRCDQEGLEWEGSLACQYLPGGESTVEVLAPEEIAGVKAIVREEDWSLAYEGEILNILPVTEEELSGAVCLPRLMDALREGWLLEEGRETWAEKDCLRLRLDQTGQGEGKIISVLWLDVSDGTPVYGEVALEETTLFTVEFTAFSFCDIMSDQEAAASNPNSEIKR